jgi:hypothetical protein
MISWMPEVPCKNKWCKTVHRLTRKNLKLIDSLNDNKQKVAFRCIECGLINEISDLTTIPKDVMRDMEVISELFVDELLK